MKQTTFLQSAIRYLWFSESYGWFPIFRNFTSRLINNSRKNLGDEAPSEGLLDWPICPLNAKMQKAFRTLLSLKQGNHFDLKFFSGQCSLLKAYEFFSNIFRGDDFKLRSIGFQLECPFSSFSTLAFLCLIYTVIHMGCGSVSQIKSQMNDLIAPLTLISDNESDLYKKKEECIYVNSHTHFCL